MNDNGDMPEDIDAEDFKNVKRITEQVMETLYQTKDQDEALRILASVVVTILCFGFSKEETARDSYDKFTDCIGGAMDVASRRDFNSWTGKGTPH